MTRNVNDKSTIIVRKVAKNEAPHDVNAVPSVAGALLSSLEEADSELCVVFLGTSHKQKLFKKLSAACQRFENHIQYKDTYYLDFNFAGRKYTIELTDPGLAHTGAREMAIRKADAVILCYASHDAESFHRLASLSKDFDCRRQDAGNFPPTLLICDEDEVEESEEPRSSSLEGYESSNSSTSISGSPPRQRASMKRIELSNENPLPITDEQGRNMANLFGPQCVFLSLSISNLSNSERLIDDLVKRIRDPDSGAGSPTKRKTSRQDFRAAITARLRRRQSLAGVTGGGSPSEASAKSSVESEPSVSSADATESPVLPFRRVQQFVAFSSIPPMFWRQKAGKLRPAGSSVDTALQSPCQLPDILNNRELELETTIIESGEMTKIHIFGNKPMSALPLNIDGGRTDDEPVTPKNQPSSQRFHRQKRSAGKNSALIAPPAVASAGARTYETSPKLVIVRKPSETSLPTPPSRRSSGNAFTASTVCTIS